MDLRILGAREFFLLAADCRDAARKDLERELRDALGRSVKPMSGAIKTAAGRVMPTAGGYRQTLVPALKLTPRAASSTGIRLTVSAKGKTDLRDVRRLDRGELRHPVFGRYRRVRGRRLENPWATTRIRPGFVTRTFDRQAGQVIEELGAAVEAVADKLAGG